MRCVLERHQILALPAGISERRDRGATVFFSSHTLGDAEALCSRVAILSKGRLVSSGLVSELTAAAAARSEGGWDVVVDEVSPALAAQLARRTMGVTRIAEQRYAVQLPASARPEPLIAELTAAGAKLISVNPATVTLEHVFLSALTAGAA